MTGLRELGRRLVRDDEIATEPLSADAWAEFEAFVRHQRLEGVVVDAIATDRLRVTEEQRELALSAHLTAMERSVSIEALVGLVVDRLAEHGIAVCALKGVAACRLDRSRPELRSFFDADLLVRPEDLEQTYATMTTMGLRRRFVEPAAGFDRDFGKGSAFTSPDRREIDLHRTLAMGALGISVDPDELWSDSVSIEVAGRPMQALGAEARALHACVHAAASTTPPRWPTLIDLVELDRSGLELDRFIALCRSWRYDAVVLCALDLLATELGPALVPTIASTVGELRATRLQQMTLDAYRRPDTGYASRSVLAVPVIKGWRRRARFVRALAKPRRPYVEQVHGTTGARWRSAFEDVHALIRRRR